MDFPVFKDQLLLGVISILICLLGYIGSNLINILQDIRTSVLELNTKIAVIIERTDNHEKRLDRLEEKL